MQKYSTSLIPVCKLYLGLLLTYDRHVILEKFVKMFEMYLDTLIFNLFYQTISQNFAKRFEMAQIITGLELHQ